MVSDKTICTAVAQLDDSSRAGLANGARLNASAPTEPAAAGRFWLALADTLEEPSKAREAALRTAAADLATEARRSISAALCRSRNLVATSDPNLAEFWNEAMCLLLEVDTEQKNAFSAAIHSYYGATGEPPC